MVFTISSFLLEASDDVGKAEESAALCTALCAGNLWCKIPLKLSFQNSPGKNMCSHKKLCVR